MEEYAEIITADPPPINEGETATLVEAKPAAAPVALEIPAADDAIQVINDKLDRILELLGEGK